MTWINLILGLIRAAGAIADWLRARQLIKAGEDRAIASAAIAVLQKTEEGKRLRDYVNSLPQPDEDSLWDRMLMQEKKP
jgi:hypothetical protein